MKNVKIFLSSNADSLATLNPTITVEAEYGNRLVEGSILSLAHHGERKNWNCPSVAWMILNGLPAVRQEPDEDYKVYLHEFPENISVGVSHVDLDTLLGIYPLITGSVPEWSFCAMSEFVDTHGPHRLGGYMSEAFQAEGQEVREKSRAWLYAFWAWSKAHRCPPPPRDGSVLDITEYTHTAVAALGRIFADDKDLLAAGKEFAAAETEMNRQSFVDVRGKDFSLVIRETDNDIGFVNHLYACPLGTPHEGVLSYNRDTRAVTLSLAQPIEDKSCCEILQQIYGSDAGGHVGIAGSPRSGVERFDDAVVEKIIEYFRS